MIAISKLNKHIFLDATYFASLGFVADFRETDVMLLMIDYIMSSIDEQYGSSGFGFDKSVWCHVFNLNFLSNPSIVVFTRNSPEIAYKFRNPCKAK